MKQCKYCKIEVDTTNDFCPLCFNHLDEGCDKSEGLYSLRQKNETTNITNNFLIKFFIFLSICAITTCVIINLHTHPETPWFWVVTCGILYIWVLVCHTILSKQPAFLKILLQIISIMLLLHFTEKISIETWVLPYVYPSISLTILFVLIMILSISSKRNGYVLGFSVIIMILTIVSLLITLLTDYYELLNFINIVLCLLTLIGLFMFGWNAIKEDILKKWHL